MQITAVHVQMQTTVPAAFSHLRLPFHKFHTHNNMPTNTRNTWYIKSATTQIYSVVQLRLGTLGAKLKE